MPLFPDALIRARLAPFGIEVTPTLAAAVRTYAELLLRWNARINLTSVTDPAEILERHFGESMFAAHAVPVSVGRLADIGSGAGFPGLALKLASQDLSVTLIESSNKKATFLAEVVRALNLEGVETIRARLEEFQKTKHNFDFVSARAVGNFDSLLSSSSSLLAFRGQMLLWVGNMDSERIRKKPGYTWNEPILVPRSRGRVLLVGAKRF